DLSHCVMSFPFSPRFLLLSSCLSFLHPSLLSFPTRRSSDLPETSQPVDQGLILVCGRYEGIDERVRQGWIDREISLGDYVLSGRSEEHTSELQSRFDLVCRLLLEKKKESM